MKDNKKDTKDGFNCHDGKNGIIDFHYKVNGSIIGLSNSFISNQLSCYGIISKNQIVYEVLKRELDSTTLPEISSIPINITIKLFL